MGPRKAPIKLSTYYFSVDLFVRSYNTAHCWGRREKIMMKHCAIVLFLNPDNWALTGESTAQTPMRRLHKHCLQGVTLVVSRKTSSFNQYRSAAVLLWKGGHSWEGFQFVKERRIWSSSHLIFYTEWKKGRNIVKETIADLCCWGRIFFGRNWKIWP